MCETGVQCSCLVKRRCRIMDANWEHPVPGQHALKPEYPAMLSAASHIPEFIIPSFLIVSESELFFAGTAFHCNRVNHERCPV